MVAMNVWPTDAADGSVASEARWRKMARTWTPSAVVAGVGGAFVPSLTYPNLTIQAGAAWVDGHFCELLSSQVLTVTANGLAVVRFDPAANTAELLYRDAVSVPAQSPTGVWEMPVARISGSALTDVRPIVLADGGLNFATVAARDMAYPTPGAGVRCFVVANLTEYRHDGIGWVIMNEPEQPYAPTLTGISFGAGWTLNGFYHRSDGWCDVTILNLLGATAPPGSFTGTPGWSPPFAANAADVTSLLNGSATFYDASGSPYGADVMLATTTRLEPRVRGGAGNLTAWGPGVPVVIADGDRVFIRARYRMASRY